MEQKDPGLVVHKGWLRGRLPCKTTGGTDGCVGRGRWEQGSHPAYPELAQSLAGLRLLLGPQETAVHLGLCSVPQEARLARGNCMGGPSCCPFVS